jgi:hypothetical protein
MRRWLLPGVLLLAIYLNLSLLTSPRGFLGTDTGGKVATLRAMDRCGCLDPDVGYWAERWDRDGSLHPLYYARPMGTEAQRKWVDVTTLPMLAAALPLWELGGYRAALLLPMAGAVAAALAAAAVARRAALDAGPRAYAVAGLASPLAVYALDLWEHAIGAGLVGWAVVLLYDLVDERTARPWRAPAAALLFGLAATMRTEALVYGAVAAVVAATVLLWRRAANARRVAVLGAIALPSVVAPLVANEALERAVVGAGMRASRAASAASVAGDAPAGRGVEALQTTVAAGGGAAGVVLGAAIVLALALAWRRGRSRAGKSDARFALAAVAAAAALFAVRAVSGGLGFVPGMAVAWTLAAGALVTTSLPAPLERAIRRRSTVPVAIALAAIPLVLLAQYRGGAAPQWGGRYLLPSGLLLTAAAVAQLRTLAKPVATAMTALAVGVTAFGVAWLAVRSHDVARTIAAIERRPEPVVVSTVAHLAREGGASYGDKRWLTALGRAELREAASVVEAAGEERLLLVEYAALAGAMGSDTLPGFRPAGRPTTLRLFSGVDLRLTAWTVADRTDVRR